MNKTRKIVATFLVTVVMTVLFFVSAIFFSSNKANAEMAMNDKIYHNAEHTLKDFLGMEGKYSEKIENVEAMEENSETDKNDAASRMTQRVTVIRNHQILPISGTVTKVNDAFYPGTYEINFNTDFDAYIDATVTVRMHVAKDEPVYIFTGSKEKGYSQYDVVYAKDDNYVTFTVNTLRDYTISTTDIIGAQKAMEFFAK